MRYPVHCPWYNARVDKTNTKLHDDLVAKPYAALWRLKGFWSKACQETVFAADGTHLSPLGNRKLYNNLRAAMVSHAKDL